MSDESSHPEPADRPATTIWERYESTRGWIGIVFVIPLLFCLIPLFGAFMGLAKHGVNILPKVLIEPLVVQSLLLGILSGTSFGLSQGSFGTGKMALRISFSVGLIWLTIFVFMASFFRDVRFLSELTNPWTMVFSAVVLIPGLSIFFVTYLLWRSNQDQ